MKKNKERTIKEKSSPITSKKPYKTPALKRYGTIPDLTMSTGGVGCDSVHMLSP